MTMIRRGRKFFKDGNSIEVARAIGPAKREQIEDVQGKEPRDSNGRSQYLWIELNDDARTLILGVIPQGRTAALYRNSVSETCSSIEDC